MTIWVLMDCPSNGEARAIAAYASREQAEEAAAALTRACPVYEKMAFDAERQWRLAKRAEGAAAAMAWWLAEGERQGPHVAAAFRGCGAYPIGYPEVQEAELVSAEVDARPGELTRYPREATAAGLLAGSHHGSPHGTASSPGRLRGQRDVAELLLLLVRAVSSRGQLL